MTPKQIIAEFRQLGLQDDCVFLEYLETHVTEARLENGTRLIDASDFKAWLYELSEAAKCPRSVTQMPPPAQRRYSEDSTCPRCGHIHQGLSECGEQLGGGRVCRCEMAVPA
ncbi:MAG TPA: hypothetical protein VHX11_08765 [Acidobacteriaceae bacterium]|jgi:hypothetical protein|nr:hypothetical protein [Acidobacteriaceae bacterium]